jgi:hypothetical protein
MLTWLEPKIIERIYEVVEESGRDQVLSEQQKKFMKHLEAIPTELRFALEELFNASLRSGMDFSYRSGFRDGLDFGRKVYNELGPK